MTIQDLYEEYICDYCKNCKNRNKNLCNINVVAFSNMTKAKCDAYEKEHQS
jgi:hypothetical protein